MNKIEKIRLYVSIKRNGDVAGIFKDKVKAQEKHNHAIFECKPFSILVEKAKEYYCLSYEYWHDGSLTDTVKLCTSIDAVKKVLSRAGYIKNGKIIAKIPYCESRADEEGYVDFDKYITEELLKKKTINIGDDCEGGDISFLEVQ